MIRPPSLPGEQATAHARMFRVVALSTMGVTTVFLTLAAIVEWSSTRPVAIRALLALAFVDTLCLALLVLNRRGASRLASWILVLGLIGLGSTLAIPAGGVRSPGIGVQFLFVLMAGILLGMRAGIIAACVSLALMIGLLVAGNAGMLPPPVGLGDTARVLVYTLYMGVALALLRLATGALQTALARARDELAARKTAQSRLEHALQAGGVCFWVLDLATRRYTGDAGAFALFGEAPTSDMQVDYEALEQRIHPDDRADLRGALAARLQGNPRAVSEFRILQPEGGVRHVEIIAATVHDDDGTPAQVVGMLKDITARKEASAERERLVFELNERVKELRLLRDASRLLQRGDGMSQELVDELVASIPPAFLVPAACKARIVYGDLAAATPGFVPTEPMLTVPIVTPEGVGTIEVCYVPPLDPNGGDPFLVEERQLLHSLAEVIAVYLSREIADRRRRVADTYLRQSQKMEALGTLAGGIAHDFNTILTAIGGNVELAKLDLPEGHPAQESLDGVMAAHERARDMVRRILAFSRKHEPTLTEFAVAPLVEEVVKLLSAAVPKKVHITSRVDAPSARVRADASQLHQVLMNLGTNGAHAMHDRAGELTFVVDVVRQDGMAIPELRGGEYVRIQVKDTGVGMAPDVLERVFEPFFTTKGQDGTGLGLSVVHGIVRDHGGAITATSSPGAGSTFEVYLPSSP